MAGKIFINYRRGDDPGHTGRLFDWLQDVFDRQQLFIDVDNIAPGIDFVRELDERVGECDVMLAVIGKGWIDARDATGMRRLDDPNDFVRIEIASALSQGKRVIPVLVGEAQMPRAEELPDALKPLARRNAMRLTHERFSADIQGLARALQKTLNMVESSRPTADIRLPREGSAQSQASTTSQTRRGMTPIKIAIVSGSGMAIVALFAGAIIYLAAGKPPVPILEPSRAPIQPSPLSSQPTAVPTQPASQPVQRALPPIPPSEPQPSQQSAQPIPHAAETGSALIDVATVRKTLPQDIPINPDMLQLVQTDPFFANAPPFRVASYSAFTKGKNDVTDTTDFKLRPIGRGLAEYEQSLKVGENDNQEDGIMAANGLIRLSTRFIGKYRGKVQSTGTAQITQIDRLSGSLLPVAVGNQFRIRTVSTYSSPNTSDLTQEDTCRVSEKRAASEFWRDLTGDAFIITCQRESSRPKETTKLGNVNWIFFAELGFILWANTFGLNGSQKVFHTVLTNVTLAP
jgi:hypothetical protein